MVCRGSHLEVQGTSGETISMSEKKHPAYLRSPSSIHTVDIMFLKTYLFGCARS